MEQQGEGGAGREARDLTVTRQRVVDPPYASEAVTELVRVAFGLVAVGLGVGALGSWISVRSYLTATR